MTYAMERLIDNLDDEMEKREQAALSEGVRQGIEKGIESGIELEKYEVAKAALLEGSSVEFVAKITKLELEKIQKIQQEIAQEFVKE